MDNLLNIININHSFNGLQAVNNFSATISKGDITGIIGPNGAGKTTLFNIITGYLIPQTGTIYFENQNIKDLAPFKISRIGISRSFQELRLINELSLLDNVLLSRPNQLGEGFLTSVIKPKSMISQEEFNNCKALDILKFIGLSEKKNDLVKYISYGQQKLLCIACCLATEAKLLLLDEPISGVDRGMIKKILVLLQELANTGKTILFIEHNIEAVKQICDQVIVLDHGKKIAEGLPNDILENQKILEAYLE